MRRIIAVLGVLCLSASTALADYAHPPGWDNDPFFTHQSWEFLGSSSPASPDGEPPKVNPGAPIAMINSGVWTNTLGSGNGGWKINGPIVPNTTQPQITLIIPNVPDKELLKEIWLQVSYQASSLLNIENEIELIARANGSQPYEPKAYEFETIDQGQGLGRMTAWIDIFPQPECEMINLAVGAAAGQWIFIDEIDVDTRCIVPEPATLAILLGAGFLCFVLHRRRG